MPETPSDDEQDWDSRAPLVDHHSQPLLSGYPEGLPHPAGEIAPSSPSVVRLWRHIGAKLKSTWSPSPDLRQVARMPRPFSDAPSRTLGGDGLLGDIGKGAPPREGFKDFHPRTLAGPGLHRSNVRDETVGELQPHLQKKRRRKLVTMTIAGLLFFTAIGCIVNPGCASSAECKIDGSCNDISRIWGQYSPVFAVPSEIDPAIPKGCEVTFGQVLSRHGARYPTAHKTKTYNATITRIQSSVTEYGKGYEWLKDYVYSLGADDLTEFGQEQLVDSGKAFYKRYKKLARNSEPFIRASSSDRVVMSSYNFTQGFYSSRGESGEDQIGDILIVSEDDGSNNTMSHGNCAAFEEGWVSKLGDDASDTWNQLFVPSITARLNKNLPGANITDADTISLMDLCPFNTVNTADAATRSKFCDLFTKTEWRSYDYSLSVNKYYDYGNGNPLGPTQGVGYVNELIARLTKQPVVDHTTVNTTLDASPKTFPLDRALYADFSHDNTMVSVFSAMGLYNETQKLPTDHIVSAPKAHGYSSAWVVPFGARMYVEKLECKGNSDEYVRVLINDRVIPLKTCGGDKHGRCKLDDFVESLSFARNGGLWDQCAI